MNSSISFSELHTDRLILRRLTEGDGPEIFTLRSDENVNRFLDRAKPENIEEAIEFIRTIKNGLNVSQCTYWAIQFKNQSKLMGTICLWNFTDEHTVAEIGFELMPEYQGMGVMQEAIQCVIKFGFEKVSLVRIDANTQSENTKSIRLLERNHFELQPQRLDENNLSNRAYSLTPLIRG